MTNALTTRLITRLLSALVLMTAFSAMATPVTWNLKNVVFADGGTASGSFVFDADFVGGRGYSNIAITTSNLGGFGATYGTMNPNSLQNATLLIALAATPPFAADLTGTPLLAVSFASALTNSGGTVNILFPFPTGFTFESTCANTGCSAASGNIRNFVSGQVTTNVPEPSTMALAALALLGVGLVKRRKERLNASR
jgi:PEP-CTERM motif